MTTRNVSIQRSAVIAGILAVAASASIFAGGHKELRPLGFIILPLATIAFPGFVAAFTALNAWRGGVAWQIFAVAAPVNFLLYWPAIHALRLLVARLRR